MPVFPKHQSFVPTQLPDNEPAPPPAPAAVTPAERKRLRDYFDRSGGAETSRLNALRMTTRTRKLALLVVALVLAAAGTAAALSGSVTLDWLRGLERWQLGLGVLALVLIAVPLALPPVAELPTLEELEQNYDRIRDIEAEQLLGRARRLLGGTADFDLKFFGYPEQALCKSFNLFVGARSSHDLRTVRFTPVTVIAVKLERQSIAIYEGTVDLSTGGMATERLVEVPYREIVLERSSLGMRTAAERGPDGLLAQMREKRALREKDTLTIRFAKGESIAIVLRDSSFAGPAPMHKLPLSQSHDTVEQFWQRLRANWLAALDPERRPSSPEGRAR